MNLSVFSAVSYFSMLSLGMLKLYNPAPIALRPPTATAPSRAPTNQPTSGPATINGPMPGIKKNAESTNNPDVQPQKRLLYPSISSGPGIVVTDQLFIFVNVASNNRQFFHIEPSLLEFLNCSFGGRCDG
jgi:hypothetical protein